MAYLRVDKGRYYYIMRSFRRGGRVTSRMMEYLGANPDTKRLKGALRYWGVKERPSKGKGDTR